MTNIKVIVNGASVRATADGEITSGMVGIPVSIEYDQTWKNLVKFVSFRAGNIHRTRNYVSSNTTVPWEVLRKHGPTLKIGVEGRNEDGSVVIPTCWASVDTIREGATKSIPAAPDLPDKAPSGEVPAVLYIPQTLDAERKSQARANIGAAPEIVATASGTAVSVADASDAPLRGLTLYGKTTQNGTPTPDAPVALESSGDDGGITVKVTGKNIFDISTAGLYHSNSNTPKMDMSITDTGIYLKPIKTLLNDWSRWGFWLGTVKELAGKTITLSAKVETTMVNYLPKCFICTANIEPTMVREKPRYNDGGYLGSGVSQSLKESQQVSNGYVQATYTITGEETMPYVCILFQFSYGGDVSIDDWTQWSDIQVEIGDTATAYEPYKEAQRIAIPAPDGLPGIPVSSGGNYTDENGQAWICDEIDLARGTYVQRVTKVVFDGSTDEKWSYNNMVDTSGSVINQFIIPYDNASFSPIICTHYPGANFADRKKKYGIIYTYNSGIGISISPEEISSAAAWRAFLAENPIDVQYILATPIETALDTEEIAAYRALHTNKPHTAVLNDAGAGMAVSYVADTKTYIDNKIYEVAAAIVSNA